MHVYQIYYYQWQVQQVWYTIDLYETVLSLRQVFVDFFCLMLLSDDVERHDNSRLCVNTVGVVYTRVYPCTGWSGATDSCIQFCKCMYPLNSMQVWDVTTRFPLYWCNWGNLWYIQTSHHFTGCIQDTGTFILRRLPNAIITAQYVTLGDLMFSNYLLIVLHREPRLVLMTW